MLTYNMKHEASVLENLNCGVARGVVDEETDRAACDMSSVAANMIVQEDHKEQQTTGGEGLVSLFTKDNCSEFKKC